MIAKRSFVLLGIFCYAIFPLQAIAQNLEERILDTPIGGVRYVLPEGYCVLDSKEGIALQSVMNKIMPPPRRAIIDRFIPCYTKRAIIEDKIWPEQHGMILVEEISMNQNDMPLSLDEKLRQTQKSILDLSASSPFVREIMEQSLKNIPDPLRDRAIVLMTKGNMGLVIEYGWTQYLKIVQKRLENPFFKNDAFPLGIEQNAVWWGGIERSIPQKLLGVVSATTYFGNLSITMSLSHPLTKNTLYYDLQSDILPAITATRTRNMEEGGRP